MASEELFEHRIVTSPGSLHNEPLARRSIVRRLIMSLGLATAALSLASCNSYGSDYGPRYGYQNPEVRQELRECRRELRQAENRREYQRELRECRRELRRARNSGGYESWDNRWRNW